MNGSPVFEKGATAYIVDETGGTWAFLTQEHADAAYRDEQLAGAAGLTKFTVTVPREGMTYDEMADYACSHGPDTTEREKLERSYNKLRVEMGYEPVDFDAPIQPLAEYYQSVKSSDQITEEQFDAAEEAAIEAIISAGYDADDSDQLGAAMSEDVQTLLALAFVRCPELVEVFTHTLYDPTSTDTELGFERRIQVEGR